MVLTVGTLLLPRALMTARGEDDLDLLRAVK